MVFRSSIAVVALLVLVRLVLRQQIIWMHSSSLATRESKKEIGKGAFSHSLLSFLLDVLG
jgi:uncharacterized protein (UPF0212 family)